MVVSGRKPAIGVIGTGLIGGSIVKTASRAGYPVIAMDRDESLREPVILSGSGWAHTFEALATRSDIIVIAVPSDEVPGVVEAIRPFLTAGQIITDVSSTKTSPTTALSTAPTGVSVVGGHPLAGGTPGGWGQARTDLFDGCMWVLCPQDGETVPAELTRLIVDLGAHQTLVCSPEEHDRAVASISHGVQAASTAIASAVGSIVAEERLPWMLAAGGWRDTTRIAESDPDMWVPVLLENAVNVVPVLAEIEEHVAKIRAAILDQDAERLRVLIEEGNAVRERWASLRPTP